MFLLRSLTIIILLTLQMGVYADEGLQCHKVVVAGDSQWPPYTIVVSSVTGGDKQTEVRLSGVGIDLAKRIFSELDVPVEEFAYSDLGHMMQGLRDGEIDLVVSTYDTSGIASDAQLLQPAYLIDPITVAVPIDVTSKIKNWSSLTGLTGVKTLTFNADDQTIDFIIHNLNIPNHETLLAGLQSVKNGAIGYVIGSDLQLTYGIKHNDLNSNLIVMKNLTKDGDVYMAFAKNSACKQYSIYVQKRLQDYKNNGTVEKLLKKYVY